MAEPGEENTGIIILRLTERILLGKYNTCWLLFCSKGVVHKLRNHFWGVPRFLHNYITFALKHLVAECFKPSFSSNPKSSWPEDLSLVLLRQGVTAPNVHCGKTTPPSSVSALVVSAAVHKNHILRMELLLQLQAPDPCSVVCTELALVCIQLQVQLIYHLHFLELRKYLHLAESYLTCDLLEWQGMPGSWTFDRFLSGCICVFLPVVFVPSAFAVEQGVITLSVDRHPWTAPVCSPPPLHNIIILMINNIINMASIFPPDKIAPIFVTNTFFIHSCSSGILEIFKMSLPGPDFC